MERGVRSERGDRERWREKSKFFDCRDRSFHKSPAIRIWRDVLKSSHYPVRRDVSRGPTPRDPWRHNDNNRRLSSDHITFNGVDGASKTKPDLKRQGREASPERHQEASRGGAFKKSFRDLFSEKDIEEGGDWVRVKRKSDRPRARHRSPIIKRPCFRCGLDGHFRRNCPKRLNMRCYGCSSTSHLVKDCTVIHRPDQAKVELTNVFEITDKVQALSYFAIFRARGEVNINTLRAALIKGVWEKNWEGKIIPIDSNSFLVGFDSECHRDMVVLSGRIMFKGFSGIFYEWNEDKGAVKIFRPVIVWVTLVSLPLHFWGKEEITKIVSSFGKVHKFDENLFSKKRADLVKVLVEVEDISMIPLTVQCSYKAITDNKYRFYNVKLVPSATCLPVSQWTEDNYRRFVEEGGTGGVEEEEVWGHEGGEAHRNVEAGDQERFAAGDAPEGSVNAPMNAPGVHATEEATLPRAEAEHVGRYQRDLRENAPAELSAGELERRRKGKGVASWVHEVVPDAIISGSGSCEPLKEDGDQGDNALSLSPGVGRELQPVSEGKIKEKPIVISSGNSQDEDMGGEGLRVEKKEASREEGETVKASPLQSDQGVVEKKVGEPRGGEAQSEKTAMSKGSRGSSVSVPPGFPRKPKSQVGASSPFGKLQRGGFKFLKRPASSSSSGPNLGPSAGVKKNKPISAMADKDIADVARNVGVEKELTGEQIGRLKALERDRASS